MLKDAEDRNLLHGFKPCARSPSVSHLLFADDSLLLSKASIAQAKVIKNLLDAYEKLSGQRINIDKSTIYFSPCVRLEIKAVIKDIFGLHSAGNSTRYLGAPTFIGRSRKEVFEWIKSKVWSKVNSWKEKFLSKAGKEVMIKSVLQSLPVYAMSVFRLPCGVTDDITRLLMRFWWGNKVNGRPVYWSAWRDLCKPKSLGGLGFKEITAFNTALLGKQCWRLIQSPDSLVAKVLRAKYFPNSNFLAAKLGRHPSYTWRSLLSARHVLLENGRWRVGDGRQINFWNHSWVISRTGGRLYGPQMADGNQTMVSEFIDYDCGKWREEKLQELLGDADVQDILKVRLPVFQREDKFCWPSAKFGEYTVKSGYRELLKFEGDATNEDVIWKVLWNLQVPPKIQHFIWRVLKQILPTKRSLFLRRILPDDQCPICLLTTETIDHVFLGCRWPISFWSSADLSLIPDMSNGDDSILRWLKKLAVEKKYEDLTLVVVVLWMMWGARNAYIFRGERCQPTFLFQKAKAYVLQYAQAKHRNLDESIVPPAKW